MDKPGLRMANISITFALIYPRHILVYLHGVFIQIRVCGSLPVQVGAAFARA